MASQMFSSSWRSLKNSNSLKLCHSSATVYWKFLHVDCDNKSLHTFPVVVLAITFQGNKPFYMPLVCILSQPFRKSKESEKLNDAKKSREDWGSPIFAPVSLRFFPAFYFSPAFHNLNAYDKVVFFRKKEMAKQLCCSIFCLLTFFFFRLISFSCLESGLISCVLLKSWTKITVIF